MERVRVNLTLAAGDFDRLVKAAAADGKLPSAFAADVLKAFLMRPMFQAASEPVQAAPWRDEGCICAITPHERIENKACPVHFPPVQNREQRRALQRQAKKNGK